MSGKLHWVEVGPDLGGKVLKAGPFTVHRRGKVPDRQGAAIKDVYFIALEGRRVGDDTYKRATQAMAAAQALALRVCAALQPCDSTLST